MGSGRPAEARYIALSSAQCLSISLQWFGVFNLKNFNSFHLSPQHSFSSIQLFIDSTEGYGRVDIIAPLRTEVMEPKGTLEVVNVRLHLA